jgi:hypothetical protein
MLATQRPANGAGSRYVKFQMLLAGEDVSDELRSNRQVAASQVSASRSESRYWRLPAQLSNFPGFEVTADGHCGQRHIFPDAEPC